MQNIFFSFFSWMKKRYLTSLPLLFFCFLLFLIIIKNEQSLIGGRYDIANPYFLCYFEYLGMVLVSKPLNGDNYSTCCIAMVISLNTKSNFDSIDGTTTMPSITTNRNEYAFWKKFNNIVLF